MFSMSRVPCCLSDGRGDLVGYPVGSDGLESLSW